MIFLSDYGVWVFVQGFVIKRLLSSICYEISVAQGICFKILLSRYCYQDIVFKILLSIDFTAAAPLHWRWWQFLQWRLQRLHLKEFPNKFIHCNNWINTKEKNTLLLCSFWRKKLIIASNDLIENSPWSNCNGVCGFSNLWHDTPRCNIWEHTLTSFLAWITLNKKRSNKI